MSSVNFPFDSVVRLSRSILKWHATADSEDTSIYFGGLFRLFCFRFDVAAELTSGLGEDQWTQALLQIYWQTKTKAVLFMFPLKEDTTKLYG